MAEISRYQGVCFRATLTELLEYTLHDVYNRNIKSHDRPPQQGRNPSPHRRADNQLRTAVRILRGGTTMATASEQAKQIRL